MAKPKKIGYQGQKLPEHVKEAIKQMYAVEPNKSLVARTLNVNLSTVYRVLKQEDPEIQREKRREAMGKAAQKLAKNAEVLIDDISTPPEDATYMQKATVMGITVDKWEKLDKRLDDQQKDDKVESGDMFQLPTDVEALAGLIRNDLREIGGMLGYALIKGTENLVKEKPEEPVLVEAEIITIDDLDPGATDAQRQSGSDRAPGKGQG
jgi:hypothetical protein